MDSTTGGGGGCAAATGRSSAVKNRKAPLLAADTGTGIFDEIVGDGIRLKERNKNQSFNCEKTNRFELFPTGLRDRD